MLWKIFCSNPRACGLQASPRIVKKLAFFRTISRVSGGFPRRKDRTHVLFWNVRF
jgi:hypothetical protein